jgi:hypothetical protein
LIKLVVAKSKGSVGREPKHYENDTPHTAGVVCHWKKEKPTAHFSTFGFCQRSFPTLKNQKS